MSFTLSYATMRNVLGRPIGRSVHEVHWNTTIQWRI